MVLLISSSNSLSRSLTNPRTEKKKDGILTFYLFQKEKKTSDMVNCKCYFKKVVINNVALTGFVFTLAM